MHDQFSRELKISGMIIAASFAVFFGVLYLLTSDMANRAAADAQFAAQLDSQSLAVGALAQNKRDASIAALYQKAFDALLPSKDQILSFPEWLSSRAQIWRITVTFSFDGDEVAPQGANSGYVNFSLKAQGNGADLAGFFDDIESKSTQYLVSFDGIDASQSGDLLTVSAAGRVFFK